ncbi:MAG: Peptidase M16 domain protein, partial [candidate division TM6 bacterium GW2011_GWF2_36_6]
SIQNSRFDENHFNSEVKTVMSELNLRRKGESTNPLSFCMPYNHPYTRSIIGTREDLVKASASDLRKFYKENYTPEKTVLIVVGNIDQNELIAQVESTFGAIPAAQKPTKREYCAEAFIQPNEIQKNVTVHTQTEKPSVLLFWTMPGSKNIETNIAANAVSYILQERLLKLKDSYAWVFSYGTWAYRLLDLGVFGIDFSPKTEDFSRMLPSTSCVEAIHTIIQNEIHDITFNGPRPEELENFKVLSKTNFAGSFVSANSVASLLSEYIVNNNEYEAFDRYDFSQKLTTDQVKSFCKKYLKPGLVNQINIVPLQENEKGEWTELQNKIDAYETKLLSGKNRDSKLDEPKLLGKLPEPKVSDFEYEKPDLEATLSNGLKVYIKRKTSCPEVRAGLSFKNYEYLSLYFRQQNLDDVPSYASFMLMEEVEGTAEHPSKFSKKDLIKFFDSLGAEYAGGTITCQPTDLETTARMALHILTHATYPEDALQREINNEIQQIKLSQDNLNYLMSKAFGLHFYKDYPWTKTDEQIIEQLQKETRQDLLDFCKQWVAPQNMFLTIVGNIDPEATLALMEKVLGGWKNDEAKNIEDLKNITINDISNPEPTPISIPHPDEQISLYAGRLSTTLGTNDALALSLVSDYLNRKLFEIREQTGLFYYCCASTEPWSYNIKDYVSIGTRVSPDKLEAAKQEIIAAVNEFAKNGIPQNILDETKKKVKTELAKAFSTPESLFGSYRYLIKNNLSFDHCKNQIEKVNKISLDEVNAVIKKYFDINDWSFIVGGRIK